MGWSAQTIIMAEFNYLSSETKFSILGLTETQNMSNRLHLKYNNNNNP